MPHKLKTHNQSPTFVAICLFAVLISARRHTKAHKMCQVSIWGNQGFLKRGEVFEGAFILAP